LAIRAASGQPWGNPARPVQHGLLAAFELLDGAQLEDEGLLAAAGEADRSTGLAAAGADPDNLPDA